jgi:hypothetical protein
MLGALWAAFVWGGPAEPATAGQAPGARPAPPAQGSPALVPEPSRLTAASADLLARLQRDPFNYFRFLNGPWAQRVCEAVPWRAGAAVALAPTRGR